MRALLILISFLSLHNYLQAQDEFICKDTDDLIQLEKDQHNHLVNHRSNALTQNYDITYHRLEWEVDPAVSYISGIVTTYFTPTVNDFNQINFDLVDEMVVNEIIYHDTTLTYSLSDDNLQIELPEVIENGMIDSIQIIYEGAPANTGFGAFATGTHNGEPTLWTLSEPYGAKSWWPCKQDLNDKIDSIDILVTTPELYRVGSNGLLINEMTDSGYTTFHWRHRYAIPAYLISLAVANYQTFTDYVYLDDGDSIMILNYVYEGNLEDAQNRLNSTVEIMQLFNDLFGLYPFADEKYGHAEFGWGGGMEHQTMSSMGSFSYGLQAHELAHQWFGDKVTCGSWQDIWLNEGFATYLTALTTEYLTPNLNDWNNWKISAINTITNRPNGSTFVDDTTSVNRIFSSRLTYTKGAFILHMLRWVMGDDDFFQSLRNYLSDPELAYGYARTTDLKNHMEAVSGIELTEFLNDWFYGQGYPSYTIDYIPRETSIDLTISQITSHNSVEFFEMPLPIKISGSGHDTIVIVNHTFSGQDFHIDLPFTPTSIEFDPDHWILSRDNEINMFSKTNNAYFNASDITLYPIPVSQQLNIIFDQTIDFNEIRSIAITDIDGRVRWASETIASPMQIDLSHLHSGTYFVTFISRQGSFVKFLTKI